MIAVAKVKYWDSFDNTENTEYLAIGNCESYGQAAEYLERYYDKDLISVKIDILDTEILLSKKQYKKLIHGLC